MAIRSLRERWVTRLYGIGVSLKLPRGSGSQHGGPTWVACHARPQSHDLRHDDMTCGARGVQCATPLNTGYRGAASTHYIPPPNMNLGGTLS